MAFRTTYKTVYVKAIKDFKDKKNPKANLVKGQIYELLEANDDPADYHGIYQCYSKNLFEEISNVEKLVRMRGRTDDLPESE